MALKTKVLVTEITSLSDARYCAGMGVDSIGFRIDKEHEKYIDLANYQDITGWVVGVDIICETNAALTQDQKLYEPNIYLIDNIELLATYEGDRALWHIPVPLLSDIMPILKDNKPKISGLILDGENIDNALLHIDSIRALSQDYDVYLGFGVNAENVNDLIDKLPIKGLALKGGDEIRSGYKDYGLADILELLEEDD